MTAIQAGALWHRRVAGGGGGPVTLDVLDYDYTPWAAAVVGEQVLGYYDGTADGSGNSDDGLVGIVHQSTWRRRQEHEAEEPPGSSSPVGNSTSFGCHLVLTGSSGWITHKPGFTGQVSICYQCTAAPIFDVLSGEDATGGVLASQTLGVTPSSSYDDLTFTAFKFARLTFAGTAKSIRIIAPANQFMLDTVAFGPLNHVYPRFPGFSLFRTAPFTVKSDGTVVGQYFGAWCTNPQPGVGAGFWIRATPIAGSFTGDALNTWLSLASDRTWAATGTGNRILKLEIASDAAGSNIVGRTDQEYSQPGLRHMEWIP